MAEPMSSQMKGSYVLLTRLAEGGVITVGKLGDIPFLPGYYAYVGSAMGGVEARVNRHLREDKKRHWHIDYLLEKACIIGIGIYETEDRAECSIAQVLSSEFDAIPGFGCSDCQCWSHLFFATGKEQMEIAIKTMIESLAAPLTLQEV